MTNAQKNYADLSEAYLSVINTLMSCVDAMRESAKQHICAGDRAHASMVRRNIKNAEHVLSKVFGYESPSGWSHAETSNGGVA